MTNGFTKLEQGTPAYKECVKDAILRRDIEVLTQIKAQPKAPIHIVQNWFAYGLMNLDAIVIYSEETKADLLKVIQ